MVDRRLDCKSLIRRLYRRALGKCVVCGCGGMSMKRSGQAKKDGVEKYWYCSLTCACYDGTYSVRLDKDRELPEPSLWRGVSEKYYREEKCL